MPSDRVPTARTPTVPASSMADVAFLLLVFFLVVTAFRDDIGIPADLPPVTEQRTAVREILRVQVSPSGALAVAGEPQSPEAIRTRVAAFASGGGPVEVQAHREAPYSAYVGALDAVLLGHRDAGVPPRLSLPQPVE